MRRARLIGAALLFLSVLPGCGIFTGDRRTLCERWRDCRDGNRVEACPVGYPVTEGGCAMPIPSGGPFGGAPIMMGGMGGPFGGAPIMMGGPPPGGPLGAETLPPPGTYNQMPGIVNPMPPRIPKIGIDEGKGKPFELESRTGPAGPALPVNGTK
jgi:hypothetical protein